MIPFLVGALLLAFVVGLLFRKEGAGVLDTMSSGCIWIVIIIVAGAILFSLR